MAQPEKTASKKTTGNTKPVKAEKTAKTARPPVAVPKPAPEPANNNTAAQKAENTPQKQQKKKQPKKTPRLNLADKTPQARKKNRKLQILEKAVDVAGFQGVRRSWNKEGSRTKNVCKSLGEKFADMVAGRVISMTFRLMAIAWVVGAIGGISTGYGMLALLAVATGTANVLYTFSKDVIGERIRNRKQKKKLKGIFNRSRAKKLGGAFAAGFIGGGFGLWLARTEIFQNAFHAIQGFLGPAGESIPNPKDLYAFPEDRSLNEGHREFFESGALAEKFGEANRPLPVPTDASKVMVADSTAALRADSLARRPL